MTLVELGKEVKSYRNAYSLSQCAFARLCGVSNTTISNIESGTNCAGKPFSPHWRTEERILRVLWGEPDADLNTIQRIKEEPTMTEAEIQKRNAAKLRSILLALLDEEDAAETTPAAVTPPPTAVPTQKNAAVYQGYRVGIDYDKKSLRLSVMDGDTVLVTGWSYIRHYKEANDPVMDMIAAISYAAHMAYKNYEQGIIGGGGGND